MHKQEHNTGHSRLDSGLTHVLVSIPKHPKAHTADTQLTQRTEQSIRGWAHLFLWLWGALADISGTQSWTYVPFPCLSEEWLSLVRNGEISHFPQSWMTGGSNPLIAPDCDELRGNNLVMNVKNVAKTWCLWTRTQRKQGMGKVTTCKGLSGCQDDTLLH